LLASFVIAEAPKLRNSRLSALIEINSERSPPNAAREVKLLAAQVFKATGEIGVGSASISAAASDRALRGCIDPGQDRNAERWQYFQNATGARFPRGRLISCRKIRGSK
jgi:hypothetical protein